MKVIIECVQGIGCMYKRQRFESDSVDGCEDTEDDAQRVTFIEVDEDEDTW